MPIYFNYHQEQIAQLLGSRRLYIILLNDSLQLSASQGVGALLKAIRHVYWQIIVLQQ